MHPGAVARERGYTVAELLFVAIILGVLVSVAVAAFFAASDRAERTACRANVRVLQSAVYAFQGENGGVLPNTLADIDPYVQSPDIFDCCPSDSDATYDYDPATGLVTCTLHP